MYIIKDYRQLLNQYIIPTATILIGIMLVSQKSNSSIIPLNNLLFYITLIYYLAILLSSIYIIFTFKNYYQGIIINQKNLTIEYPSLFSRKISDFSNTNSFSYEPRNNRVIITGNDSPIVFKVSTNLIANEIRSKILASKENHGK